MAVIFFDNPDITYSGYTLSLGENSAQINYDVFSGGLFIIVRDNQENILAFKPVSFDTNMIFDLFNDNQKLILNSTSNKWEWYF